MSITAKQIFEMTMDLIDERLDTGLIDEDATADYKARTPGILTTLQNELLPYSDTYKTFDLRRVPIEPVASVEEIVQHEESDINVVAPTKAYGYYFEADGPGTAYIEELVGSWNILETITINDNSYFEEYKGLITPDVSATSVRIRFSGNFYYNYTNVALYDKRFSGVEKVPEYKPYIKIDMPDDFKSISQIVTESYPNNYVKTVDYYWEKESELHVNRRFEGEIRVIYRPSPGPITSIDDTLVLDDVMAASVLPYGLGAKLMATENVSLGSYLQSIYDENKFRAVQDKPQPINPVEDVYDVTLGYRGSRNGNTKNKGWW